MKLPLSAARVWRCRLLSLLYQQKQHLRGINYLWGKRVGDIIAAGGPSADPVDSFGGGVKWSVCPWPDTFCTLMPVLCNEAAAGLGPTAPKVLPTLSSFRDAWPFLLAALAAACAGCLMCAFSIAQAGLRRDTPRAFCSCRCSTVHGCLNRPHRAGYPCREAAYLVL